MNKGMKMYFGVLVAWVLVLITVAFIWLLKREEIVQEAALLRGEPQWQVDVGDWFPAELIHIQKAKQCKHLVHPSRQTEFWVDILDVGQFEKLMQEAKEGRVPGIYMGDKLLTDTQETIFNFMKKNYLLSEFKTGVETEFDLSNVPVFELRNDEGMDYRVVIQTKDKTRAYVFALSAW